MLAFSLLAAQALGWRLGQELRWSTGGDRQSPPRRVLRLSAAAISLLLLTALLPEPLGDVTPLDISAVVAAAALVLLGLTLLDPMRALEPRGTPKAHAPGGQRWRVGLHLALMLPAAALMTGNGSRLLGGASEGVMPTLALLIIAAGGAVLAIETGGDLIGRLLRPTLAELDRDATPAGLTHGGRAIGRLERAIIFGLVLIDLPGGIGFLLAAKSILRFGEVRDPGQRKMAEYIIIGTLMSFGWALLIATLTRSTLQTLS